MATLCFLLLPRDTNEWSLYIVVDNCTGEGSGSIHTHKLYRGGSGSIHTHTHTHTR